jgi:hypothetical protein
MVHAWFLRHLIFVAKLILLSIFCFHGAMRQLLLLGSCFCCCEDWWGQWKVLWGQAFVMMQLLVLSLQWTFPLMQHQRQCRQNFCYREFAKSIQSHNLFQLASIWCTFASMQPITICYCFYYHTIIVIWTLVLLLHHLMKVLFLCNCSCNNLDLGTLVTQLDKVWGEGEKGS